MPVEGTIEGAVGVLPDGERRVKRDQCVNPSVKALAREGTQEALRDVKPTAMLGRIVNLEAFGERSGLGWGECLVEGSDGMCVQVIHDQPDQRRFGIVYSKQFLDLPCPVQGGSAGKRGHMAPRRQRLAEQEDAGGAATDVFAIQLGAGTLPHGERFSRIRQQLVRLFIHAYHGDCRIKRQLVQIKDILHAGDERGILFRGDAPVFTPMGLQVVFLKPCVRPPC